MLPKPEACKGCLFYGDGKGFVPDELRRESEVFIYAQNPGEHEEAGNKVTHYAYGQPVFESVAPAPLIGPTGFSMEREYFPVASLSRDGVSLGNSLRCRLNHSNKLPPLENPKLREALLHCHRAHFKMPESTKLIVTQGEYALYALTQEGLEKNNKITDWRGYVVPFDPISNENRTLRTEIWTPKGGEPIPVFAVNHLAYIFRAPHAAIYAKRDWSKVPRILAGKWPVPLPRIQTLPVTILPRKFSFDTEFVPESGKDIRYSMAYKTLPLNETAVHVVEIEDSFVAPVMIDPPTVILHQALADLDLLEERLSSEYKVEDTMHAHSVLWAGLDHDLNTLGSLYATINRWKHLEYINPVVYSAGDAVGTLDVWNPLEREFERDLDSKRVYYDIQLKLIQIIRKAKRIGIKVNQPRSMEIMKEHKEEVDQLYIKSQALAGWPINITSGAQTGQHLYKVEKIQEYALARRKE